MGIYRVVGKTTVDMYNEFEVEANSQEEAEELADLRHGGDDICDENGWHAWNRGNMSFDVEPA